MACEIKIFQPVTAYQDASGKFAKLRVSGSASDCETVLITIMCSGTEGVLTAQVLDGLWSAVITNINTQSFAPLECACDKGFEIKVACAVGNCSDMAIGIISCDPLSQCPTTHSDIDLIDPNSDCVNGMRTVSGTVNVFPDTAMPAGCTVKIDGQVVGSPHGSSGSPYTIPFAVPLGPGKHLLTWTYSDDVFCGGGGQTITVPPCKGCPAIDFHIQEDPCVERHRKVTVTATIPDAGVQIDATLLHNGSQIDHASKSGPITLTGSFQSTAGVTDQVTVSISGLPDCVPTTHTFMVDPCDGGGSPPPPIGGGGGGGDDGDGSGGCIIGRIFVVMLFAAALFLTVAAACAPAPPIIIAAAAAWLVAGIAFALWLVFCGTKCGSYLVLWQSWLFGTWLAAFLIFCCPWAVAAVVTFGALAVTFFTLWVTKCHLSFCRIFLELTWVTAVPVALMFTALGHIVPCGMVSGVEAAAAVTTAIFAAAAAAACKANI